MIYLLKFGASFLMVPGIFIVLLFVIAFLLWRKNERRIAGIMAGLTAVFYLFSTSLISGLLIGSLENEYPQPASPEGDIIIMLGGGATADTPSLGERGDLTSAAGNRLLMTAQLYNLLKLPVLVSGSAVFPGSGCEAEIAKRDLIRLGVPEEKIYTDTESLNTRQNAVYSAQLMREHGFNRPILVTSAFHMPRSVLNFEKEGVQVVPFPTDYMANSIPTYHLNKFAPSSDALFEVDLFLREKLRTAVTKYLE